MTNNGWEEKELRYFKEHWTDELEREFQQTLKDDPDLKKYLEQKPNGLEQYRLKYFFCYCQG